MCSLCGRINQYLLKYQIKVINLNKHLMLRTSRTKSQVLLELSAVINTLTYMIWSSFHVANWHTYAITWAVFLLLALKWETNKNAILQTQNPVKHWGSRNKLDYPNIIAFLNWYRHFHKKLYEPKLRLTVKYLYCY